MISVIRIRNQQEATPGKINPTRSIVDELILLISYIRLEYLLIEMLLACCCCWMEGQDVACTSVACVRAGAGGLG